MLLLFSLVNFGVVFFCLFLVVSFLFHWFLGFFARVMFSFVFLFWGGIIVDSFCFVLCCFFFLE